jgi:hypothetical protein
LDSVAYGIFFGVKAPDLILAGPKLDTAYGSVLGTDVYRLSLVVTAVLNSCLTQIGVIHRWRK